MTPPAPVARPIPETAVDDLREALEIGTAAARYYDAEAGIDVVDFLEASYADEPGPLGAHLCGSEGAAYVAAAFEGVREYSAVALPDDAAWSCEVEGVAAAEVVCHSNASEEFFPTYQLHLVDSTDRGLRLAQLIMIPKGVLGHDWAVEAANAIATLAGCGSD